MTINVAIIGCGAIGIFHCRAYSKLRNIKVIACCDKNLQRAKDFAQKFDITKAYNNLKKLFENESIDAVSVCTPNYAHKKPTILALEAGINVLCEKPIAMNTNEAEEMLKAYKKSKKLLTIGHHYRFLPEVEAMKNFIDKGMLGDIYYARSKSLRRSGIPGWGEFHIKKKSGGGSLIDIGVHMLDMILYMMGFPQIKSVSGSAYKKFGNKNIKRNERHGKYNVKDFDVEDFASAYVRFKNGATLSIESAWAANIENDWEGTQQLFGDKGGATLEPFKIFTDIHDTSVDITPFNFPEVDPYQKEIEWFIDCIKGKKQIRVKPEECLQTQRIIDAIYLSSKTKKEIVFK